MPDIRYVCLSDMHLGADSSVLTNVKPDSIDTDNTKPGPVLSQFVTCLKELIAHNQSAAKPTLILNGDILEMALAETNEAAMAFDCFIELVFPADGEALFDKDIFYIPGNHDHHIWESARETQYVNFISSLPVGSNLEIPWHTTKMFAPDPVREYFLTNLLQRYKHLKDASVNVLYPNYALLDSDGKKCIIFSHGHYVESIYSLMSTLNTMFFPNRQKPKVVWDLEAENFAWVDFFWSTMGRSGDVGEDIGLFYDKLQSKQQLENLIANFSTSLVQHDNRPRWLEGVEAKGIQSLLDLMLGRTSTLERNRPAQPLSPDAQLGLQSYLEGPLLEQICIENKQHIPADITFLFGHTHKPFQQEMIFNGYPAPLKVYNSGGWVVDSVQPKPIFGAAVLLIDENLQVASLHMYEQAASAEDYAVHVEQCPSPGAAHNSFHDRISALVNPAGEPWKTFSELVAAAVLNRAQVLQTKINM